MFKKDKIYKIVYEPRSGAYYDKNRTLLVVAKDPMKALNEFYRIVKDNVVNITEFVAVTPKEEEGERV